MPVSVSSASRNDDVSHRYTDSLTECLGDAAGGACTEPAALEEMFMMDVFNATSYATDNVVRAYECSKKESEWP